MSITNLHVICSWRFVRVRKRCFLFNPDTHFYVANFEMLMRINKMVVFNPSLSDTWWRHLLVWLLIIKKIKNFRFDEQCDVLASELVILTTRSSAVLIVSRRMATRFSTATTLRIPDKDIIVVPKSRTRR